METVSSPVAAGPFNAVVKPGLGGYGGWQLSISNASTPQDLAGTALNIGAGGGRGLGGGLDLSVGPGAQGPVLQLTATLLGLGFGGYGHGGSPVTTTVTPMCPR